MRAETTIAEWRAKALGAQSRIDLAFRRLQLGLLRSGCGCPDRPDEAYQPHPDEPCDWSHWHPNQFSDGLREDRFCWKCGSMETQELKL